MPDPAPTAFVVRLAAQLADDARVEGLWLEGDDDSVQWPPYEPIDLHFAVPEPFLEAFRQDLPAILARAGDVTDFSQQQAPLQGWAGTSRLPDGTPLTYRLERTSQLGKLPRRAVNLLLDRTGGLLLTALSFERD
jgi:hypothetical protein